LADGEEVAEVVLAAVEVVDLVEEGERWALFLGRKNIQCRFNKNNFGIAI
jgi:hypothetical protein